MVDILIVGAGPTGLACALEAQKEGLNYVVIEKGSIVDSIRRFPVNMTFFSTPELLELDNIPFTTLGTRSNRSETVRYYQQVAQRRNLQIKPHTLVTSVEKVDDTFKVTTDKGVWESATVVIATGYFDNPNMLGVKGEDLPFVHKYYTEPFLYAGAKVVVVGGKNSACETALDLWRHGAHVTIVYRKDTINEKVKYWVRPDLINRLEARQITGYFGYIVREIRNGEIDIQHTVTNAIITLPTDFVIPHVGYRPDIHLLQQCGIEVQDDTLIPTYNPNTFETNIPGLFVAGSVMCGCKTWNIFIENSREHAKPIIHEINNVLLRKKAK